jgi:hypothetical protein
MLCHNAESRYTECRGASKVTPNRMGLIVTYSINNTQLNVVLRVTFFIVMLSVTFSTQW